MLMRLAAALAVAWTWTAPEPAAAQGACSARAAAIAARPYTRVVSVRETGNACRIRIVVERPGRLPRSRVIVVRR